MKAWLKIDSPEGENLDYCPIEMGGDWQETKTEWDLCDGTYGLIEYLHVHGKPATENHYPADDVLAELFKQLNAPVSTGVAEFEGFTAEIVSSLPEVK